MNIIHAVNSCEAHNSLRYLTRLLSKHRDEWGARTGWETYDIPSPEASAACHDDMLTWMIELVKDEINKLPPEYRHIGDVDYSIYDLH